MSAPKNLNDCYTHELQDNWSAKEQMEKCVRKMAGKTSDSKLKSRLEKSADGIAKHTETIKSLLDDCGISEKEHCKGMEGLVSEAKKHAIDADISDGDVRDVVIIAQYQRMCHYGICGFGTAKAFAEALGKKDHVTKLDQLTADTYQADENMSDLAERSVNLDAKESETA
ncbi:ferritin-like domain-containing protein [Sphingomicrobium sp. XHP0239]|uniref:YciE/YciF ferroxidase family protein n=1 Tax=Sphingomicrobium maritimum TaxID=3133972 RepID=UPI0031CCB556